MNVMYQYFSSVLWSGNFLNLLLSEYVHMCLEKN